VKAPIGSGLLVWLRGRNTALHWDQHGGAEAVADCVTALVESCSCHPQHPQKIATDSLPSLAMTYRFSLPSIARGSQIDRAPMSFLLCVVALASPGRAKPPRSAGYDVAERRLGYGRSEP
jgi:hypothetical protein